MCTRFYPWELPASFRRVEAPGTHTLPMPGAELKILNQGHMLSNFRCLEVGREHGVGGGVCLVYPFVLRGWNS